MRNPRSKRLAALLLALVLTLLLTACPAKPAPTPEEELPPLDFGVPPDTVAGTFTGPDGVTQDITADRYLAFLSYAAATMAEQRNASRTELANPAYWNEPVPLDGEQVTLRVAVHRLAQELLTQSLVVDQWMTQRGVTLSLAEKENIRANLETMRPEGYSIDAAVFAVEMIQSGVRELFFDFYKRGGENEVPEALLRPAFERYFLSYKQVLINFHPVGGERMSDAEIAAAPGKLKQYQDLYKQYGDFDKLIAYANGGGKGDFAQIKKPEGMKYWQDITTADPEVGESAFTDALRDTPVGETTIFVDENSGSLLLRLDPEQNRDDGKDYFAQSYNNLITIVMYNDVFRQEMDAGYVAQLPPVFSTKLDERARQCTVTVDAELIAKLDPMKWYV